MEAAKVSKQQANCYQKNKRFISRSYASKEEFVREYTKLNYDKAKTEELFLLVFTELEKAVSQGNTDNLKRLSCLVNYASEIKDKIRLKDYYDNPNNPIRDTNLVILACKQNKQEILKCLFDSTNKILHNLLMDIGRSAILPDDTDETCHNAFYYAIRSGNVELLDTLVTKWPDNYFNFRSNELNEILSRAYKELKLKNIPLSYEIEVFVVSKLINQCFFSDTFEPNISYKCDLDTIKKRIELVLEHINLLKAEYSNAEKVDEKFLFVTKFIAQNIHVLKQQLKSTYDRLPWEEMEFYLVSFVSAYIKRQEINLFYYAILSKKKILNQLDNFGKKLEEEKINIEAMDITKISDLPKSARYIVVANIINDCPEFEELYNDYQQIRDMYTLEKMYDYIRLALSVCPSELEGQIIIIRALQVFSEHLRNTLESPTLSDTVSELLLLSLPEYTREIVIDLHDSESHVYTLCQKIGTEKDADDFFDEIQNDIEEVSDVISDILYDNKMKMIRILLKRIVSSQNLAEIKEIMSELNNIELDKMCLDGFKMNDHERLEISIQSLRETILYRTDYEKELFNKISNIINFARTKLSVIETDYIQAFGSLKLLRIVFNGNKINYNVVEGLKFFVSKILENIDPEMKSHSLKEIAELSVKIFNSVTSRLEDDYHIMGDEIKKSFLQIFYTVELRVDDINWIRKLREELIEDSYFISMCEQKKIYTATEQEHKNQLVLSLTRLKIILNDTALNDRLISTCSSYKDDDKLQVAISTLVLHVLSVLNTSGKCLKDKLLFLDDDISVLTGRSLYNYLAHDNALIDVLLLDPSISAILNARKLSTEYTIENTKEIGTCSKDDPSNSKDKLDENLAIVTNQQRMFVALETGNLEDLKDCLKKGADLNARNFNFWTALHFAAKGPSLEVIKFVLGHKLSVNVKNIDNQSPLHIAAAYDRRNIVEFFVKSTDLYIDNKDSNGKTPLHIAAQDGNTDIVDILLKNKANPNIKDIAGFSPLHSAVKNNHIAVVQLLLKKEQVDVNELIGGFTSLHMAAEYGHLEMINFLLKNGANINAKSDKGAIALHPASLNGHLDVVNALILKGVDVNLRLEDGNTSLHYAVANGHVEVTNVLLKYGANANVSDKACKNTPLHLAVKTKYVELVKLLLKYKARVNAVNVKGMTPLHFAVQSGHLEAVAVLLESGAIVNAKDNNKVTALHYAAEKGYTEIADVLIKNKADVNAKDNNRFTPLYLAVMHDHKDVTELLINNKAEVNTRESKSCTPLHLAVVNNNEDIIDILIKNKAKINVRNCRNITPLHTAAAVGNITIVDLLLKNKADVNVKSNLGITPLHAAVIYGHEEVILLLIDNGAQPHCVAKFGATTLQSAVKGGYTNIVNLLIQHKADVNSTGCTDLTPLHIAVESRNKELVQILIQHGASVNVQTKYKMTPLSFAVKQNWKEIVEILIANGADVNATNGEALSFAAFFGYKEIMKILLENNARTDLQFMDNKTPLHIAAVKPTTDFAAILLEKEADVHATDKKGATPLHYAARCGNAKIVELLLLNGANVNVNCTEGTPLHYAVYENDNVDVVRVLLDHGADVSLKDSQDRTPLQVAVTYNQLECVKLMKLQSQKIDINMKDGDSWTVLHNAAREGNLEMVKYLIGEGSDINAQTADGTKPIHIAVKLGFKDIVEFLFDNGSNVHDVGTDNQTLLHYAAMTNEVELARYLISKGADINAQDDNGLTPVHTAAKCDHEKVVEVLLENSAVYNMTDKLNRKPLNMANKKRLIHRLSATDKLFDVTKHNNYSDVERFLKQGAFVNAKHAASKGYDETALHCAAWKGYEKVVNILAVNRANLNIIDNKGFTPLHYAAKFSHAKVVMQLLCNGAIYNAVSEGGKTPLDLAVDRNIIKLLKLVNECFNNVINDNLKVITDLNKIRDINTVAAIMNARNRENQSLVVVGIKNKFSKVQQLKEVSQPDVSREIDTGLLYLCQEDYTTALNIFRKVYIKRRNLLGPDNPATLDMQVFIAKIQYKQGIFEEALDMFDEIYRKQKEMFGFDNENTLSTRSMYALILHRQGKDDEAFTIFDEVYKKQKEILGEGHSDTLDTQFHLAIVLQKQGKYEEALTMNREVYRLRKELLGANHQTTICTQNNIAIILSNQGKYEEALKMYKMVYEKKKAVSGANHSETIRTLFNIAGVLFNQKKYDESLKAHQEILDLQIKLFGLTHPDTLNTQYNLANVLFAQNKWISAFKVYDECLDNRISVFGLSHSSVADIIHKMELINFRCKLEGSNASEIVKHVQVDINHAATTGNTQTLRGLLTNGADANDKDNDGRTPLHYAVSNGHLDVVNVLLENGADVTQVTAKGNTALHTATSKKYKEIVEVLLRHVSREKMVDFLNAKTSGSGVTSLHVAAKNGSLDIIKCLLKYGASYNITNKDGKTPCDVSSDQNVKDLFQLIDKTFKDMKNGTVEVLDNLKSLNTDECLAIINTRDERGCTLMQVAVSNNKKHIAAKLLKMIQQES